MLQYVVCVLVARELYSTMTSGIRRQLAVATKPFLFSRLEGLYDHFLQVQTTTLCFVL